MEIITLDLDKKKIISYLEFFIKILMKSFKRYEIIYINHWSNIFYPFILKSFKNKKVIINYHGSDLVAESYIKNVINNIGLALLPKKSKVVVPSKYFKNIFENKKSKFEVKVIPSGGVDTEKFYKINKIQKVNDKINIGFCSGVTYGKGYDIIIKLISNLKENNIIDKFRFNIVEYGSDLDIFKSKIRQLDLEQHLDYYKTMKKEEMINFYNKMDYILFPTRRKAESLGLVPLESMACGVPVIANKDFAIPEYVENGKNGFLFSLDDDKELFEIFKMIHFNKVNYEYLSENAIKKINQKYSKMKCVNLYNEILKGE